MYILGISAYYHDSAAALIKDGSVVCAFEEERFSRIKHDNNFPFAAINKCLDEEKIKISDIKYIAYYEKPLLKFERIVENFIETYPKGLNTFLKSIPEWLGYKIKVEHTIKNKLKFKKKIFFIPHHLSHASSAYYPSGFKDAAILSIDGVGEYETTTLWKASGTDIEQIKYLDFPQSLGLLYSTFTAYLGFKVNNDEYKMMGLSAYGKPKYVNKIKQLISIKDDGSFDLKLKYFSFRESFKMWSSKLENLLGKPRQYGGKITQRDMDIASSIQVVTEEIYFKIINHLKEITGAKNLCITGGVALNSLANGKLYDKCDFENIYNLGAAGDSGAAIGCALFVYHGLLKNGKRHKIDSLRIGNSYSEDYIEKVLINQNVKYIKYKNRNKLINDCALLLSKNKIVGWFEGRMEFGPRALGSRSIIANPKMRSMKDNINKIKKREEFRPFACSVLEEKADFLFEVPKNTSHFPFMNFCFKTKKGKQKLIASIVHEDNTCRIQTVSKDGGNYFSLIQKFYEITGIPCLLNTSFNVGNEPIVENPENALSDFFHNPIDVLVLENFLVYRDNTVTI